MIRVQPETPPHMSDQLRDLRFGNRRVPKMYAQIQTLRKAIADEGTTRIQDAWDKVEEHLDYAYQMAAEKRAADEALESGAITVRQYAERTEPEAG